jgi:hypothetical protein
LELLAQVAANRVLAPPLEGAIASVQVGGGQVPEEQGCELAGRVLGSQAASATGVPSLRWQLTARVCVPPPPQPALHGPKGPVTHAVEQPEVSVHGWVVGGCGTVAQLVSATAAPSLTRWQVRGRVCVPVPQVALHAPQLPTHW